MPRRARIAVAGIPWHVIQRGNNRAACFYGEADYRYYLQVLGEQSERHGCSIHAYILMTNHVHLLLTPHERGSTASLMKHLGQRYVQYVNRTYGRSGTLWEGRFRSCLAQERAYVLTCYRYIELNPVRAGMVIDPAQYPWSSYRANALGECCELLSARADYRALGGSAEERCSAYRQLFQAHLDAAAIKDIRRATNGNYVVGNDRFKDEIASMLKRRVTPGKAGRPKRERNG